MTAPVIPAGVTAAAIETLAILERDAGTEHTVYTLAELRGRSVRAVRRHVRELQDAGLVSRECRNDPATGAPIPSLVTVCSTTVAA